MPLIVKFVERHGQSLVPGPVYSHVVKAPQPPFADRQLLIGVQVDPDGVYPELHEQ